MRGRGEGGCGEDGTEAVGKMGRKESRRKRGGSGIKRKWRPGGFQGRKKGVEGGGGWNEKRWRQRRRVEIVSGVVQWDTS